VSAAGALALVALLAGATAPPEGLARGRILESVPVASQPGETYALYLPTSYDPSRPSPILYAFDPRARGKVPVERFQAAAERHGWIVAGSNASRNAIAVAEIVARLWDDTHSRLAIDPRRVYMTGFSGGSRVAAGMALRARGAVTGVIGFGAGLPTGVRVEKGAPVLFFTGAGRDDFNLPEMHALAADLDAAAVPNRLEIWDGGHEWAAADVCTLAVEWLELRAMRAGARARDEGLLDEWLRRDLERGRQREAEGALVEAARAYAAVAADFDGLRDVAEARQAAARLRGARAYKDAASAAADDDERQGHLMAELNTTLQQVLGDADGRPAALMRLRASLTSLRRATERGDGGREERVARRTLSGLWAQIVEASNGLRGRKEYRLAADTLALAGEIRPLGAGQHYELARLHALGGDVRGSLRSLERALDAGFRDAAALEAEPDFERVRRSPEFAPLVERARSASSSPAPVR
jgi:poly(3-hydroxybutyrate) depolymerase